MTQTDWGQRQDHRPLDEQYFLTWGIDELSELVDILSYDLSDPDSGGLEIAEYHSLLLEPMLNALEVKVNKEVGRITLTRQLIVNTRVDPSTTA